MNRKQRVTGRLCSNMESKSETLLEDQGALRLRIEAKSFALNPVKRDDPPTLNLTRLFEDGPNETHSKDPS